MVSTDWRTPESSCDSTHYRRRDGRWGWHAGRMNATQLKDRQTISETVDEFADALAVAFLRLHRAAAIAHHLSGADAVYRDRPGWDLSLAIHEATVEVDSISRDQELASRSEFWADPIASTAVATADTNASLPADADTAHELLVDHLRAALLALFTADELAFTGDPDGDELSFVAAALYAVCDALGAATTL